MKKEYVTPRMVGERFLPNEYVAACGDSGTVYKFECNAGEKNKTYNVYYYVGNKKYYIAQDGWSNAQFGYYHPCGETHTAESDSGFISGFIDDQSTRKDEAIPVIIWTENGTNVHCTTNLDQNSWETAKS